MRSRIRTRIESVMTGPAAAPAISLAGFLSVLGTVYGGMTKLRAGAYGRGYLSVRRLPCRVVSVGNLVLGGAGKTPMTIYLAQQLQSMGFRTAVVSRGYGGRAERTGGIVSNGDRLLMGSADAGDEPYMMARILRGVPVLVGRDRYLAGKAAVGAFSPEVIILDDAFQHLRLYRDIDLLLLDASNPFGNGHHFPRGMLREPISGLSRADAVVMTRWPGDIPPVPSTGVPACRKGSQRLPLFHTAHVPHIRRMDPGRTSRDIPTIQDAAADASPAVVFAFSAIARNSDFVNSLNSAGYTVMGTRFFPDHHRYSEGEIRGIIEAAKGVNAGMLATTEKDIARIGAGIRWPIPLIVAGVTISFGCQAEAFHRFILDKLGSSSPGEVT
ncbi:Tetraacyldisaccharide 4'-kinase (EC [Olavius algarvensis associated proteobacterium Delta 3]|nr:Tetraacyldisaccharide 4'-kinase (EC [Olavius algarvensis associated proteobacterium Delta 3]